MTIAIYLRLSLEDNENLDESNSITNQRLLLKEFILRNPELNQCNIREYCDDGYSGTNFDRPGVTDLIEHVRQNLIDCIIVKDFSRFSRDYIEIGSYLDQIFPFMGVRFISVDDRYDSNNYIGTTATLDMAFKTLLNDFYCKDISIKVKSAIRSKCENGEFAYGQIPFGYERIPESKNQIRINEIEAEVIRYIFGMAAEGMTTVMIAKRLHEENIPTCSQIRGKVKENPDRIPCWSCRMVRHILDNRFYLGEFIYHKHEPESVGSKKLKQIPKSEWITQLGHHESLVSMEVFNKAANHKTGNSTKRMRPKHPLTGKLYCGGCGYAMVYKKPYGKSLQRFECGRHAQLKLDTCCTYYRVEILEELILTMITKELMKLVDLQEYRAAIKTSLKNQVVILEKKIRNIKKLNEENDQEIFVVYEKYAEGKINVEEYRKEQNRINNLKNRYDSALSKYRQDLEVTEEAYMNNLEKKKHILESYEIDTLTQEVVNNFINKIKVYKNKSVEIKLAFSIE